MNAFEKLLSKGLEFLLAMTLLVITAIVVTLVVMRYCFNSSITGANEWVTVLFVYSTAIGAALAVGREEHIAIPFAVESLSSAGRKVIDCISLICVAILNSVMVAYCVGWIRFDKTKCKSVHSFIAHFLSRLASSPRVPL